MNWNDSEIYSTCHYKGYNGTAAMDITGTHTQKYHAMVTNAAGSKLYSPTTYNSMDDAKAWAESAINQLLAGEK